MILFDIKVEYVFDGDCFTASIERNSVCIRLASIDCPESKQEWGDIATAGLIKQIGGRRIHLETHGTDVYGRTVATVYVDRDSERININERMVEYGHAWVSRKHYKQHSVARQNRLDQIENWARSKRVGLWQRTNPIPPWEWRKQG